MNLRVSASEDAVIDHAQYHAITGGELPERAGPWVLGVDLGETESMSATCGYWPQTGRAEVRAMVGAIPDLALRSREDGLGEHGYADAQAELRRSA